MRVLVFLDGTTIDHGGGAAGPMDELPPEIGDRPGSTIRDPHRHVPLGNPGVKLSKWRDQGAEIVYLSSHRTSDEVENERNVLAKYGFPEGPIYYRRRTTESYAAVAESVSPDIIIEDDCKSIGGEPEMTYPNMSDDAKRKVKSIVVEEFGGIDHLPDDLDKLRAWPSGPP
jgi:hypothetical protein